MASYLPSTEAGYLPYWLLFISLTSCLNTVQAYVTTSYTAQVYARAPASGLQSRTFGTWTFLSAVVRGYAAYHVRERVAYELAMWTFGVALAHFGLEFVGFGTVRWGRGSAGPFLVSVGSLVWMASGLGGYVL